MKDSKVLRAAKRRVKNDNDKFICNAIYASTSDDAQVYSLQKWIKSMLVGEYTYNTWAQDNRPEIPAIDYKKNRLLWLDWMIAYCEKEESEK